MNLLAKIIRNKKGNKRTCSHDGFWITAFFEFFFSGFSQRINYTVVMVIELISRSFFVFSI